MAFISGPRPVGKTTLAKSLLRDPAVEQIDRFTGFPEPLFAGRMESLCRWRRTGRELVLREDLGVAFDTARKWLEILQRLYYLFELRPFAGKLVRTLRREAMVYLSDHTLIEDSGANFDYRWQPTRSGQKP
jgi:predicted AAA+ superfamily ATPase